MKRKTKSSILCVRVSAFGGSHHRIPAAQAKHYIQYNVQVIHSVRAYFLVDIA